MRAMVFCLIVFSGFSAFAKSYRIVQADKSFVGDVSDADAAAMGKDPSITKQKKIDEIRVKVGDKLVFANRDSVPHNAYGTVEGEKVFDMQEQPAGAANDKEVELTKKGEFKVRCAIHPKMKMTVVVE